MHLVFHIKSFWHAGTGRGKSQALDMLVHKDSRNLPLLPGKTVKGLVRDAVNRAEHWGQVSPGLTAALFGFRKPGTSRFDSTPGALAFDDAQLPRAFREWAFTQDAAVLQGLYQEIHATQINPETGCAQKNSLRGMEVTIPLTLTAPIHRCDQETLIRFPEWPGELKKCLPLIRGLGVSRTRGLGRCKVVLEETS